MELKDHKGGKGDRHNQWNTDGLPDAARRIVENDRDSASWRQKLQKMEEVLCGGDAGYADMDALGYGAIYLFWVGVGAVACVGGRRALPPEPPREGGAERMYEQHRGAWRRAPRSGGGRHVGGGARAHSAPAPAPAGVHRGVYAAGSADAHSRHRARKGRPRREVPRRPRGDQAHDPEQAASDARGRRISSRRRRCSRSSPRRGRITRRSLSKSFASSTAS